MDNYDWAHVFPEVPQQFHETVQRTLNTQILKKTGGKRVLKKRFPVALAAVIAILTVTAAAVYLIQWNGKLAERFGADEQQQKQLAADGAVGSVEQSVTENGLTVTAVQTLGDKNGIYLLFDVKAPEGITLSDTNVFEREGINIEGIGTGLNYSGGFLSNTDKTASSSGAANERYYELWLDNSKQEAWNGKKITLDFTNLQADKGKLDLYTVVTGEWKLSWTLSYSDQMQVLEMNKAYEVNGHEVLVKSLDLSPLSMTLDLGGDGLKQLIDDSDLNQCGCLCTIALTLRDGTVLNVNGGCGESYTDTSYTCTARFGKVLDVDQVTSLVLTFPWEKANNTLTVALP